METTIVVLTRKKAFLLIVLTNCTIMCTGNSVTRENRPAQQTVANLSGSPAAENVANAAESSPEAKDIWRGQSGGVKIWWTTVDLYARHSGATERLWERLAKKGYDDFVIRLREDTSPRAVNCQYERDFQLLSVVGHLISYADYQADFCGGAHPGADTRFTTIDLTKPGPLLYTQDKEMSPMDVNLSESGRIIKLTDYFSQEDIFTSMLADPVIKKALATIDSHPDRLLEMPKLFARNDYELGESGYELRPDFLTRFAFHHLEGDKVAVRLGLPPHYGANRTQHMQLGLLLPIPEALKKPLALAASHQEGFLMNDATAIARGQMTKFSFTANKDDKRRK